MVLSASIVLLALSLPPPLCRGKIYEAYDVRRDRTPGARALAEVQAAYDALCPTRKCGTGQLYENPTIGNNAATWVSGVRDGDRTRAKIVYSAQFLDALAGSFGPGASFGVLAHEVGHHLTAALSLRGGLDSSWDEELRADYLAGCALGRSGRSSTELENALRALASVASSSHPAWGLRNPVVRKGYDVCREEMKEARRPGFGIGAELKTRARKHGCWGYWFRAKEEIARVGPVAARRVRSRTFAERARCEEARVRLVEVERKSSEECTCE